MRLGLSIGLTYLSSQLIGEAASRTTATDAANAALSVTTWYGERLRELAQVARIVSDNVDSPAMAASIQGLGPVYPNFTVIELVDTKGVVTATTNGTGDLGAATAPWFAASLLKPTHQSIQKTASGLDWIVTSPITGSNGTSQGVVVGSLRISVLGALLKQFADGTSGALTEAYIIDSGRLLLYNSEWIDITDPAAMQTQGTLRIRDESPAAVAAAAGQSGTVRELDYQNDDVLAGYAPVPILGWSGVSAPPAGPALAAVGDEARSAAFPLVPGINVVAGFPHPSPPH